jgi:hypothetical protein
MRTILCPIDLSGLSHRAVQYASEIAVRTGSRLVLFYAFDAPYLEPHCALGYAGEARERLEAVRQQLIGQDALARLNCHCEVRMGATLREVQKYAAATEADLIVIGTCPAEEICCRSRIALLSGLLEGSAHRVLWVPQGCRFEPLRQFVYASDLDGASLTDVSYVLNLARQYHAETAFLHIRQRKVAPVPAGTSRTTSPPPSKLPITAIFPCACSTPGKRPSASTGSAKTCTPTCWCWQPTGPCCWRGYSTTFAARRPNTSTATPFSSCPRTGKGEWLYGYFSPHRLRV